MTYVQGTVDAALNVSSTTGRTTTLGSAVTAGNSLVAIFQTHTNTISIASVTSTNATWSRVYQSGNGAGFTGLIEVWLAEAVGASPGNAVTYKPSATDDIGCVIVEISSDEVLDLGAFANGTSSTVTTYQTPTLTGTTGSGGTILGAVFRDASTTGGTVSSPFTLIGANTATMGPVAGYYTPASPVTDQAGMTASWSGTRHVNAVIVSFKPNIQNKSGSDSQTQQLTNTATVQASMTKTDTASPSLTEGTNVAQPLSGSDTETQQLTESSAPIQASTSSSQTQDLTETSATQATFAQNDAETQNLAETTSTTAYSSSVAEEAISLAEGASVDVVPGAYHNRLRIDLYDKDGNRVGDGPLVYVLGATYGGELDKIGQFSFSIPVSDLRSVYVTDGVEARLFREGEGECYRGLVRQPEYGFQNGVPVLNAVGDSTARKTVWITTKLNWQFNGTPPESAATSLLSGTAYSLGSIDTTTNLVNALYNGATIFDALSDVASQFSWHVRENNLTSTIDLGAFGSATDLVFMNVDQVSEGMSVVPISDISIKATQNELINRVIPIGAGEGVNALTLKYATRMAPYAIETMVGPDGNTIYYLEDHTSSAAHEVRERPIQFKDIAPLANTDAEVEAAANALYDQSAAYLGWASTVPETYEISVAGLRHIGSNGQPLFRVGDKVRLVYRGLISDEDGKRVWKDINTDAWIISYQRSFDASGADQWQLTISTSDRTDNSPAARIARAINDIWTIQTAMKPYTYREPHGPLRASVDTSHPFDFPVDFDEFVTYMHKSKLKVRLFPVRVNAVGASGGGSHSHSVSGQGASSGGGGTSSAGTSHSHSISANATGSTSPEHTHVFGTMKPTGDWGSTESSSVNNDPLYQQQFQAEDDNGNLFGFIVGRGATQSVDSHVVTWASTGTAHTHSVAGQTSSAESSHTHSVSAHTHSVTGATSSTDTGHTHTLTYGIYEGPAPTTPQIHVLINGTDRTTELGGPFDANFEVDITPYLTDATGHVLRQTNIVRVVTNAANVHDVEITVKSLVTAFSVVPV